MQMVLGFSDYLVLAALIVVIVRATAGTRRSDDALAVRNARKLDAILRHLNIPEPPASRPGQLSEAVRAQADQGRIIDALRLYREETGAGLREAKDAIEDYQARANT
jgi:ribosomal protein L7/L12